MGNQRRKTPKKGGCSCRAQCKAAQPSLAGKLLSSRDSADGAHGSAKGSQNNCANPSRRSTASHCRKDARWQHYAANCQRQQYGAATKTVGRKPYYWGNQNNRQCSNDRDRQHARFRHGASGIKERRNISDADIISD